MELKQFADELKLQMEAKIDEISMETQESLLKTTALIRCIEKHITELKRFVLKYKFRSIQEEIVFFKTIKPRFISQLMFYQRLCKINLFEAYNTPDLKLQYFKRRLAKVEKFVTRHREFYQYVVSGSDHMDEMYFSRLSTREGDIISDERFSTRSDLRLSKILCNERLRDYLLAAIHGIEAPFPFPASSPLTWTGSKTDLIELIYALQAAGVFNKESADLKQIATHFENVFNVNLGNYYKVFQEIRMRKTGQVNFINSLRDGLLKRIRESES